MKRNLLLSSVALYLTALPSFAQTAALTALTPNARAWGDTQIAVGTGGYRGYAAAAIGGFHWVDDNLLLNAGVAVGDKNEAVYRAGVTYSW